VVSVTHLAPETVRLTGAAAPPMRRKPKLWTPRLLLRPLRDQDAYWLALLDTGPLAYDAALEKARDRLLVEQLSSFGRWPSRTARAKRFTAGRACSGWSIVDEIEAGDRLRRESWGSATEAAARLLRYGFEELRLDRIVAVAVPENIASQKVLTKLGLRLAGRGVFYGAECCYYGVERVA